MVVAKLTPEEIRKHKGLSFIGLTVVFFCHDGNGKLLLQKRSKNTRDEHGRWDCGGGGVKHGESLQDALVRELKEEYDVEPQETEFIHYYDSFRETDDGQPTHWLAICFAVKVDPSKVKVNEPDKVDEIGWFTLDSLPSPLHSQYRKFLDAHGAALEKALQAGAANA